MMGRRVMVPPKALRKEEPNVQLRSKQPFMKPWMAFLLFAAIVFALFGPVIVMMIRKGF